MIVYKDPEQMKAIVTELFVRLGRNDEVGRKTEKLDVSFKFQIDDMDMEFVLSVKKGTLELSFDSGLKSGAVLKMDSKTFHEAMTGTLNLPAALLSKVLVIEGDTRSVFALTKLGKALNTTYKAVFEEMNN